MVQLVEAERACARSDECLHFCLVLCVKTMLAHAGDRMSLRLRSLIDGLMRPCIDQIENELAVKIPAKIVRSYYRMELGRRCRQF